MPSARKNLNRAKKQLLVKYNEYEIKEIIKLHGKFLKMKGISGIPEYKYKRGARGTKYRLLGEFIRF